MAPVMKKMCYGCPFDYGAKGTEEAYNYGCLPSVHEVNGLCDENGTAWACHSASTCVCSGYAQSHPDRVTMPLQTMNGVH